MSPFAAWIDRDVVTVAGPEAIAYLQGQLSQDVDAVQPGESALTFLLEPQGRLIALLRLTRLENEVVRLDGDSGTAEATLARLRRYLLRTKAEINGASVRCLAVREVSDGDPRPESGLAPAWPGISGYDMLEPPDDVDSPADVISAEEYEVWRVRAGVPVAGVDLDDRTVPAELGIVADAASFTKGCYVGQELVARMDARQATPPRSLRRLEGAANGQPPPTGADLELEDGRSVGHLSSVVASNGSWAALALVGRAASDAASLTVRWEGGSAEARLT